MLFAGGMNGALILDQEQISYDLDVCREISDGYEQAGQYFTAGITGKLKRIDMGFVNQLDGDGTVYIYEGYADHGALLQSLSVEVCSEDNGEVNYSSFMVDVPVTEGSKYTFLFEPNSLTMPDTYCFAAGWPDPYPEGILVPEQAKFGVWNWR